MRSRCRLKAPFCRGRFARFAGVGLAGFVVQLGVVWGLSRSGLPPLVATALACQGRGAAQLPWHQRWTRSDRPGVGAGRRLLRFHAATGLLSIAGTSS